jgi:hypothetical protein
MLPRFPFIYIPRSATPSQFRQLYPTLWLVVVSLATKDLAEKHTMGDRIRHLLGRAIVIEQKRSMDVLLACICLLGW